MGRRPSGSAVPDRGGAGVNARRTAAEFLNVIRCGYDKAMEGGVSESEYDLPPDIATTWAEMRSAYERYEDAIVEFEDVLDTAGLKIPGGGTR